MAGGDFLERMAAASHARLDAAREILPDRKLMEQISLLPHPPGLRLSPTGFDLIAEVKTGVGKLVQVRGGRRHEGGARDVPVEPVLINEARFYKGTGIAETTTE